MLYRLETELGSIIVREEIIGKIVAESVLSFGGRVMITNHKGKVVKLRNRHGFLDATDHIEITSGEKGLDLRVFIAIKFGTSIGGVTEQMIHDIKQEIEDCAGMEANSIAIVVTGLLSRQMTKRNIEVKG
ncbi:MAG: hypothetical protein CVU86_04455 [Firmicutes bacterium HGW-Firmicutes-11]|nr:MAG: hypothetical protein CVU86_04455 [Firmicutes bacterium HGW-Firmicutes-11]